VSPQAATLYLIQEMIRRGSQNDTLRTIFTNLAGLEWGNGEVSFSDKLEAFLDYATEAQDLMQVMRFPIFGISVYYKIVILFYSGRGRSCFISPLNCDLKSAAQYTALNFLTVYLLKSNNPYTHRLP
jgi:hypothetical protein